MRRADSRAVVGAALVVLGLAVTASAGARQLQASSDVCPTVTGVKWVLPYAPHTSGNVYDVHANGKKITCAQADGYVKKLVAIHVHTNVSFAGGPTGWTCKAAASNTGRAYSGSCRPKSEGFLPKDHFEWTVG